jgi:hypothetical protein
MSVRAKQSWSRRAAYAGAVLATTALAIGITPRPAEAQYPYGYPAGTSSHYPNSYNRSHGYAYHRHGWNAHQGGWAEGGRGHDAWGHAGRGNEGFSGSSRGGHGGGNAGHGGETGNHSSGGGGNGGGYAGWLGAHAR